MFYSKASVAVVWVQLYYLGPFPQTKECLAISYNCASQPLHKGLWQQWLRNICGAVATIATQRDGNWHPLAGIPPPQVGNPCFRRKMIMDCFQDTFPPWYKISFTFLALQYAFALYFQGWAYHVDRIKCRLDF